MTLREVSKYLADKKFNCYCDIEEILRRFIKDNYGIDTRNEPGPNGRGGS